MGILKLVSSTLHVPCKLWCITCTHIHVVNTSTHTHTWTRKAAYSLSWSETGSLKVRWNWSSSCNCCKNCMYSTSPVLSFLLAPSNPCKPASRWKNVSVHVLKNLWIVLINKFDTQCCLTIRVTNKNSNGREAWLKVAIAHNATLTKQKNVEPSIFSFLVLIDCPLRSPPQLYWNFSKEYSKWPLEVFNSEVFDCDYLHTWQTSEIKRAAGKMRKISSAEIFSFHMQYFACI